ncbi:MAG: hypothetical protein AAGI92_08445 [Pseudomonadota bacterium]
MAKAKTAPAKGDEIIQIDDEPVSAVGLWRRIMPFSVDLDAMLSRVTVPYIIYWTLASIFLGIWLSPVIVGSSPATMGSAPHNAHDHAMAHEELPIPAEGAPTVAIEVERDSMAGWNVFVETTNFTFSPSDVNGENVPNEGHAHIYINGQKLARLYGDAYHFSGLPIGEAVISVTLNSNDHSIFTVDGEPITASQTIVNEPPPAPAS